MSRFARAVAPAASAVRARKDGANPRLTSANAPFLTNTLREVMISSNLQSAISTSLEFRRAQRQRGHLLGGRRLRDCGARSVRDVVVEHGLDNPAGSLLEVAAPVRNGLKAVPHRLVVGAGLQAGPQLVARQLECE